MSRKESGRNFAVLSTFVLNLFNFFDMINIIKNCSQRTNYVEIHRYIWLDNDHSATQSSSSCIVIGWLVHCLPSGASLVRPVILNPN